MQYYPHPLHPPPTAPPSAEYPSICSSAATCLLGKCPSAQGQPDGLTKKRLLGAGFLGAPYIMCMYIYIYIYIYTYTQYIYIYIYIYIYPHISLRRDLVGKTQPRVRLIVAIFYSFSQFFEINPEST